MRKTKDAVVKMTDRLNPEAFLAAKDAGREAFQANKDWHDITTAMLSAYDKSITAYLAALPAPRAITGEQVNLAGWTCYGIHEPGNYATCEECRDACDDLANFYNSMYRNPVAGKTWTGQPAEGGGDAT